MCGEAEGGEKYGTDEKFNEFVRGGEADGCGNGRGPRRCQLSRRAACVSNQRSLFPCGRCPYSFAKTPLKAAQVPLAAAMGIQGLLRNGGDVALRVVGGGVEVWSRSGGRDRWMKGSAEGSMAIRGEK